MQSTKEITDVDCLAWMAENISDETAVQFGRHVMNVGGVGDVSDLRVFIRERIIAALRAKGAGNA